MSCFYWSYLLFHWLVWGGHACLIPVICLSAFITNHLDYQATDSRRLRTCMSHSIGYSLTYSTVQTQNLTLWNMKVDANQQDVYILRFSVSVLIMRLSVLYLSLSITGKCW